MCYNRKVVGIITTFPKEKEEHYGRKSDEQFKLWNLCMYC